jgi:purine-binding chemotaxis protein CheW
MDIAKIRKKFKEAAPQDAETQVSGPEEGLPGGEDSSVTAAGPLPAKAAKEVTGEEGGASPAEGETVDSLVELLTFTLAKEEYAFRIEEVQEIIRPQRITSIPKAGSSLLGITSLRGKIIPIIDLKKMLSLDGGTGEEEGKQKILILKGAKGPLGAVIDRVAGVIRLAASGVVETPAHLPEAEMKFIGGVAIVEGRFVSILRMEEVLVLWGGE